MAWYGDLLERGFLAGVESSESMYGTGQERDFGLFGIVYFILRWVGERTLGLVPVKLLLIDSIIMYYSWSSLKQP